MIKRGREMKLIKSGAKVTLLMRSNTDYLIEGEMIDLPDDKTYIIHEGKCYEVPYTGIVMVRSSASDHILGITELPEVK